MPLLSVEQRAGAARALAANPQQPLSGVRVLDLTRVLAGPIATRTLAAHGADVLRVSAPDLPEINAALPDTSLGKRSTFLDLRIERDREQLRTLLRAADVLVQSYRPGALAGLGFAPGDLAELQPDLVTVSLSAYANVGPWASRRGYDTLVQTASGIALSEAEAFASERPRHVPVSGLDHTTGYFMAAAATLALARRHTSGGGAHIECSLAADPRMAGNARPGRRHRDGSPRRRSDRRFLAKHRERLGPGHVCTAWRRVAGHAAAVGTRPRHTRARDAPEWR